MRNALLSGSAGGGTGVAGAGGAAITSTTSAGSGCGSSVIAQPANAADAIVASSSGRLVTKPYPQYVDLGCAQPAAQHVQLIEIIGRANAHTVIALVIDGHALNR